MELKTIAAEKERRKSELELHHTIHALHNSLFSLLYPSPFTRIPEPECNGAKQWFWRTSYLFWINPLFIMGGYHLSLNFDFILQFPPSSVIGRKIWSSKFQNEPC